MPETKEREGEILNNNAKDSCLNDEPAGPFMFPSLASQSLLSKASVILKTRMEGGRISLLFAPPKKQGREPKPPALSLCR